MLFTRIAYSGELDGIVLTDETSSSTRSTEFQTLKSKVEVKLGDLMDIDVTDEVKKRLSPYSATLSSYFPDKNEYNKFVDQVLKEGKSKIIGTELTDEKLIKYYDFLGTNLIGNIANRVMAQQGITDPARRDLWTQKVLEPFHRCIAKSRNSQFDADKCIDKLSNNIVPNIGVALTHELSRSNLDPVLPEKNRTAFKESQVNNYKNAFLRIMSQQMWLLNVL